VLVCHQRHRGRRGQRGGAVRAMARLDQWGWVSMPMLRVRISRKATSTCQRRTNHAMSCCGFASRPLLNNA